MIAHKPRRVAEFARRWGRVLLLFPHQARIACEIDRGARWPVGLIPLDPRFAQSLYEALPFGEIGRIVAECAGTNAGDGISRVDRKSRLSIGC
jgi:hypothetical protein